jgi:DNA-directed RNA polymerase subunit RPC12/RpoP
MPPPPAPLAPRPYYAPPMPQTGGYQCPQCGCPHPPTRISQMSQSGLIVLIVMIIFCFPLFWIGLLMKEDSYVCPQCGRKAS